MTDLSDRFRTLDRAGSPDLWAEALQRAAVPAQVGTAQRSARSTTLRVALVLIALLVLLGLGIALVGSLRDPEPSPAGLANGWIAISANPADVGGGENGDIYLVPDGGSARRIIGSANDGLAQACPRFSPDGTMIAYGEASASGVVTTFRGEWPVTDRAVVVVRLSDRGVASAPLLRISVPEKGEIVCPLWSPDGRQIAFRAGSTLSIANVESGDETEFAVAEAPWGQQEFAWSRGGTRIAVAEPQRISVVDVASGTKAQLAAKGATPALVGWTAGDERIVYGVSDGPGDVQALRAMSPDGSADVELSLGPAEPGIELKVDGAAISPDGTEIALILRHQPCEGNGCQMELGRLRTIGIDGLNPVEVPIPEGFAAQAVQWSRDGRRLLASSIAGVVSIDIASGASVVRTTELNLEWSHEEVTWQRDSAEGQDDGE